MEDITKLLCASSLFILFYSMVAKYVKNRYHIPDPLVTMLFGIAVGHHGLNILNTHYVYSKVIVLNFSRIVLCLQTMAIALKVDQTHLRRNLTSLFNLIITAGILKCFLTFLCIFAFTYFGGATSWALAAALTPTDPILSSSIVSGRFAKKNVDEHLRMLLVAESGVNDGIGIVLLNISVLLNKSISLGNIRAVLIDFLLDTFLLKIVISILVGSILGSVTRFCSKKCYQHQLLNSDILMIHSFALAFLNLAAMTILDGSELIAIFFAGLFLNKGAWYTNEQSNTKISDVIENSFFMALFVFLGSRIDFSRFNTRMFLVIFLVILIRLITVLVLYRPLIPAIKTPVEAAFIGFFGPIGVGAVYYSLLYDIKFDALTVDYAMCSVFVSVVLHGLAVPGYCLIRNMQKIRNETHAHIQTDEIGI
ncbi:NAH1 [Enterospora canceri]|uniref:NAH1 n=1 Tax=Enterospora canceri TaxID=1081671 RepID=A0A1Y1S697_9MICR|nr:NAH1 [Enterospora canceri]